MKQGVAFDAFGESCYQRYQGDPSSTTATKTGWTNTFGGLATKFPAIKFFAAEYGPMQREINDVVFGLAGNQGLGTFNWEPTTRGRLEHGPRPVAALGQHVHGPAGRRALRPDEGRLRQPAVTRSKRAPARAAC